MGDDNNGIAQPTSVVRCLNCEARYVKPARGGTVSANPGCPECGYLGWVLDLAPVRGGVTPRFFADRRPPRKGWRR